MKKIIKFKTIDIENFCGIKNKSINMMGDYTIITGMNKRGKTTIQNAISWVICKRSIDGNGKFDPQPVLEDGSFNEVAVVKVSMELEINDEPLTLSVSRTKKGKVFTWNCEINGVIEDSSNDYFKKIMNLLGFEDKELFLSCLHVNHLIDKGVKARDIIMELFDVDKQEIIENTKFRNKSQNVVGFTKRYGELLAVGNTFERMSKTINSKKEEIEKSINGKLERLDEQKSTLKAEETTNQVDVDLAKIDSEIKEIDKKINTYNEAKTLHKEELSAQGVLELKNNNFKRSMASDIEKYKELANSINEQKQDYHNIKNRTNNECENCKERLGKLSARTKKDIEDYEALAEVIEGNKKKLEEQEKELKELIVSPMPTGDLLEMNMTKHKLELSKTTQAAVITGIKDRIKVLESEVFDLREDLALEDKFMFEHQSFVKTYCEKVESIVNSGLKDGFKINLFKINKGDGGARAVFTPMINEIPFISASTSEQLDAKVSVCEIIQNKLGVELPILVDMHETKDKKIVSKHQIIASEVVRGQKDIQIRKDI